MTPRLWDSACGSDLILMWMRSSWAGPGDTLVPPKHCHLGAMIPGDYELAQVREKVGQVSLLKPTTDREVHSLAYVSKPRGHVAGRGGLQIISLREEVTGCSLPRCWGILVFSSNGQLLYWGG